MENASKRYLTKSRFKLAVDCPTKLYYSGKAKEYRDMMAENEFLAMLAEGGYQVGALAKLSYPNGIEVHEKSHTDAHNKTMGLLEQENVVLFEAAILVDNFFIRIDILVKNGTRLELIEVKAKSYDSMNPGIVGKKGAITSGMLPYIQDAAFQTWVLKRAFPNAEISTSLMMPNKSKLSPIDGLNQMFKIIKKDRGCEVLTSIPHDMDSRKLSDSLLEKVCVDAYVDQVLSQPLEFPGGPSSISSAAISWAEAYSNDERVTPVIGAQCGSCQFNASIGENIKSGFHECWKYINRWQDKDFLNGTVLDLWNFRGKQSLINQGKFKITQLTRDDIGDFSDEPEINGLNRKQRQWLQVNGIPEDYDYGGFYFDKALASVEMSRWKFPYHLIDFETATVALPFYKDMRPYEPIAFQFSHHVMEADGSVRHADEFLCVDPGEFPNYKFARALWQVLNKDDGTVFMWSHHENTILSKIIEQLAEDPNRPDDAAELSFFLKRLIKDGDRSMFDLCTMAEKTFFHPDTKGSNSIKKVLPAVLKISQLLKETYSKPIYGAPSGIPSINYNSEKGFIWFDDKDGPNNDPYLKLKKFAKDLLPEGIDESSEGSTSIIAEGGAAATAYARLQFEDMKDDERNRIKSALLRYCELDTLAMVMILQAWREITMKNE